MKRELLFEVGTEEIPAEFFPRCLDDLARLVAKGLDEARLSHGAIRTLGTPRRLALIVTDLAVAQEDRTLEEVGPPTRVAFDAEGKPTKAALHFAQKVGVAVDALERKTLPKGEYLAATVEEKGQPAVALLPDILTEALGAIPWRKSMRWGTERQAFARPIHWIVALFGDEVVPLRFAGVESGGESRGHRFLAPGPVQVGDAGSYVARLREAHVLVDPAERRQAVVEAATRGAKEAGGRLAPDDALVDHVTWLVETPSPIVGSFDEAYLGLPPEVLVSEMREHQKYFSVQSEEGTLLPAFVAIANTPVRDPSKARRGFERVLRARLADARFFYDEDRKIPLDERVEQLRRVTFQHQLGSIHDKVERFRGVARWLAEELGCSEEVRRHVERAATLAKADLVTGMVGEFPDLQGAMGREYALAGGEPEEVARAIFEHYLPRGHGDQLPTSDVGALVGIADRLDTIAGIFAIGRPPTGTADPFGLRRACLGIIHLILDRGYRVSLAALVDRALAELKEQGHGASEELRGKILGFFQGRLRNLWSEGHPVELVEAVLASGFDDLVEARARLEAVAAHLGDESFRGLAEGFTRTNIVEKAADEPRVAIDPKLFAGKEERELHDTFLAVRDAVAGSLASGDFSEVVAEFTKLREPLDRFFTEVMVMVEDDAQRRNRLELLHEIRELFGKVADFGRMDLRKAGG